MPLKSSDLISIKDLSIEEVDLVLDTAVHFEKVFEREIKKVPTLRGRTVINLFLEPSTRTRTSFEIAGKRLSADVVNISNTQSAVIKGESLKDTARTIEAMAVDAVVIRHWSSGAAKYLAQLIGPPVINAGDGRHEHPTQALLDIYTLRKNFGDVTGLSVAIVGDIAHSRVARSLILALNKLKAKVTLVGPATLMPVEADRLGAEITYALDDVVGKVDVVYLLRLQQERQSQNYLPSLREYAALYSLTRNRFLKMKKGAKIMHPGPLNRGVEIDAFVADNDAALITDQVSGGVAVRMAVLYLLLGGIEIE